MIEELLKLRVERKISQKEIARKIGCTQSTIAKAELQCEDEIRVGLLRAYAKALGFKVILELEIDR